MEKLLDDFEKDILKSVENGEWKTKRNIEDRLKELQLYIKNQKKKAISSSVSESDI